MTLLGILGILSVSVAFCLLYLSRSRQRSWKILARITALALISIPAVLTLLFFSGRAACGRYDFPSVSSPDELDTATVSEDDCGAADSFHTSVQLSYRKEAEATQTVFTIGHDPRLVELEWRNPKLLAIRYPENSRSPEEFRCQSSWRDIQIECIAYTPDYSKPVAAMPPVKRGLQ